ncbi:MAG: hypothetical protein NC489_40135 [Ruminococcus flavefaciens]|nr:hypothetical protein [Ruminococcus flavefaciens]
MDYTMKKDIENAGNKKGVNSDTREQTITKTEVMAMGFSEKTIKELLPMPQLATNPHYKSAYPMKLWKLSVVEEAMKTPQFQEALKKREKRQAAAAKAVATKLSKIQDETKKFIESIMIERMDIDVLREKALEAKQCWYDEQSFVRGDLYPKDAYSADEKTVIRWMVNYIRHELTSYDEQLYSMKGRTGIRDMYQEIHSIILDKIAEVYPELAHECIMQKRRAV